MKLRLFLLLPAALALSLVSGCAKKEISSIDRKTAENQFSEAQFAVTLHDWARAEPLLIQASKLCPDTGNYALMLGNVQVKLAKKADGKKAYELALDDFKEAYRASTPKNSQLLVQQMYILVLLQRVDDAKKLLAKALDDNPTDSGLKAFSAQNTIDRMAADANVRALQI